jgi:sulfonate transport system substrate-binding protein
VKTRRLRAAALLAATLLFGLRTTSGAEDSKIKLVVGYQNAAFPAIVAASGVLDNAPYDLQWAVLLGPAAQLSGLYSKAIDVGHMGDVSLIIEQSRAKTPWTPDNVPLQIVAGWRNVDAKYPSGVTVVRTAAGVESPADLRGHKWASNYGGINYLQFLLSRIKAGLKQTDIEAVRLADGDAAAVAFNSGQVDAYSGDFGAVKAAVDKGEARVLLDSNALGIPGLGVFAARGDVIRDPAKSAALADFLARLQKHWSWYATHLDTVASIYREKLKQTPERARYSAEAGRATFQILDADLVRREQRVADTLLESGDIPQAVDVAVEFSTKYNSSTVPAER